MRARRSSGRFLKPKIDKVLRAPGAVARPVPERKTGLVLHYQVQEKLGQGGMGVVYRAVDKKLNRMVALKFLPPQLEPSRVDLQRFLHEASALSALNHRHIATIYGAEDVDGQHFLVLEYLPGGTLKRKLQQVHGSGGVLSIDEILKYAQQTAEGLAHAHSKGIVHRDVKTSNLMLTEEGDVKITDFGVAKLRGTATETTPGSLVGTIAYMSPEQAMGIEVDARSDVFSFGVSLFELIAGRLPFEAPNEAALITRVANAQAPKLRAFRSEVPRGLEMVVEKALQKRVEKRYQTMDDLLTDLRAPADRSPILTRTRVGTSVTVPRGVLTNRTFRVAAASILMLAVLLAASFYFSLPQRLFDRQRIPAGQILAVIHLRNVSGDESNEALCDGLTELLTNKISQLEQLQGSLSVVAPSEVFKAKRDPRKNITAAEARNTLGATLVLEGAVQRIQDRVIVTVQLVETEKQTILAARDIAAPIEKLSDLDGQLLEKAAEMLKVQLRPETRRTVATGLPADPGAYELYLQGRGHLQRYDRAEAVDNALELFQQALTLDPGYALAHAGMAEAYLRKYKETKEPELINLARFSGQRAIQLNDALAPVHYAMGLIHASSGENERAIDRFKKSIQILPTPEAYRELASAYDNSNKPREAETTYRAAIQMRPTNWAGYRDLASFYQSHGKYKEALPLFEKVVQLTPDNYAGLANLGGLYGRMGKQSQAIEYYQRSIAIKPTWATYYNLGTAAYAQKQYAYAVEMYKKSSELMPSEGRTWAALADAYAFVPHTFDQVRDAYAHAIALIEKELIVNPRDGKNWARIANWRVVTDKNKALREIADALRLSPGDNFVLSRAASVYEQSGMREEALAAATAAVERGYSAEEIRSWPALAQLLQDPRCTLTTEGKPIESASVPTGK